MAKGLELVRHLLPLTAALLCGVGIAPARCQETPARLIILLVPDLRPEDLARPELQALPALVRRGATGWMNIRTARDPGAPTELHDAIYATLGAGARARVRSPVGRLDAGTVQRLHRDNADLPYSLRIGLLGELLRGSGLRTCVAGNEDDLAERRAANLVIVDGAGRVDADRSATSDRQREPTAPYGVAWSAEDYALGVGTSSAQLWVFGDLARAARYADFCTPRAAAAHRSRALTRLDGVLRSATAAADEGFWCVLVGVPLVEAAPRWTRLAPVLIFRRGTFAGALVSPSTRTVGLITATDFLPTVLREAGIAPPKHLSGRPATVVAEETRVAAWLRRYHKWSETARFQAHLGGLPVLQVALVSMAALLSMGMVRFRPASQHGLARTASAAVFALPLALLVLPVAQPEDLLAAYTGLALVLLAAGALAWLRPAWTSGYAVACCLLLAACLAVDLAAGERLLRQAWMGYSVVEGARYYGIGNEYGGCLLAAGLLLVGASLGARWRAWAPPLCLFFLGLLAAAPAAGANLGVGAAICLCACVAAFAWVRGRLRLLDVLFASVLAALFVAALIMLDAQTGSQGRSHLGQAVASSDLLNAAARKAALNAALLVSSPWSPLLLASAVAFGLTTRLHPRTQRLFVLRATGATGALALLALNDSGVVAAACCLALLAAWSCLTLSAREPILAGNPLPTREGPQRP